MWKLEMLAVVALCGVVQAGPARPEDTLSASDKHALLDAARTLKASCTGCVYPGVDVAANKVDVQPMDLAIRDKWVAGVVDGGTDGNRFNGVDTPAPSVHDAWAGLQKDCGVHWRLAVDVAVVKLWRMNTLAEPVSQAFWAFTSCSDPHTKAFAQKVKVFHVRLSSPFPQPGVQHSYTYAFDKKTGELTVGVDTNAANVADAARDFLAAQ